MRGRIAVAFLVLLATITAVAAVIARDLSYRARVAAVEEVVRAAADLWIPVVAAALALVALYYLLVRWALKPLRLLARRVRHLIDSDLSERVSVRGRGELAELTHTFNQILDELERAVRSREDFTRDVGNVLTTSTALVQQQLDLLEDDRDARYVTVEAITQELDGMARFVRELRLLASTTRPDFLKPEPIDLATFTRALFERARLLARRKWRLAHVGAGVLFADRARLIEALMGLADNAVRVTGEGDAIELGSGTADGEVRLWVRDTGLGIYPSSRDRLFEHQVGDGRSPQSGLSLAIVRAIVEAHGGRVELDSRIGSGSTFFCVLPKNGPITSRRRPPVQRARRP